MANTTVILSIDGTKQHLVQTSLTNAIDFLKSQERKNIGIEFCSIEGIDACFIYQNYTDQAKNLLDVLNMFENMTVENIAKCMLLAVREKMPILDTPKHIYLIKSAQRICSTNTLKSQAKHFMHYMEWQGFEFLAS